MMNFFQLTVLIPKDLKTYDGMTNPQYLAQRLGLHVLLGLWNQTGLRLASPGTQVCTGPCSIGS